MIASGYLPYYGIRCLWRAAINQVKILNVEAVAAQLKEGREDHYGDWSVHRC